MPTHLWSGAFLYHIKCFELHPYMNNQFFNGYMLSGNSMLGSVGPGSNMQMHIAVVSA